MNSVHKGVYTPLGRHVPLGRHTPFPWADPPPRPLQRMVCVLLECILVLLLVDVSYSEDLPEVVMILRLTSQCYYRLYYCF